MNIISRNEEVKLLEKILSSRKAEFLAIYGRRRIGKTYLVRSFFEKKGCVFFDTTGIKDGSYKRANHSLYPKSRRNFFRWYCSSTKEKLG